MAPEQLAELERLEVAATAAPWKWDDNRDCIVNDKGVTVVRADDTYYEWSDALDIRTTDCDFLLALVNHADQLISAAERCAELECIADQLESTSECEVAWFDSMYRMIEGLGGKRGKSVPEDVEWAVVEAKRLKERCAELEAIVAKLPKTADGVPVVPGDELWYRRSRGWLVVAETVGSYDDHNGDSHTVSLEQCYSTREAAEKANSVQIVYAPPGLLEAGRAVMAEKAKEAQ